jgi:hypothetical protein
MHHPTREDWEEEKTRKAKVDRDIDENVRKVREKQEDTESRDYWREHLREEKRKKEKKQERDRELEEDRQDERTRQRAINRRAPPASRRGRSRPAGSGRDAGYSHPFSISGGQFGVGDFSGLFGNGSGISFGGYSDPFSVLRMGSASRRSSSGIFGDMSGGIFSSGQRAADPLRGLRLLSPGIRRGGRYDIQGGVFTGYQSPFSGMFSAPAPRRKATKKKKKVVR